LASFEKAIRDGADGIESDVHVSLDDVVLMFHDPSLERTTNGKGFIKEKNWYGPDGMEQLRTTKEPTQSIPTFAETIALLMKPENRHAKLNVDVKVNNDPQRVFKLMNAIITAQPDWEKDLAPRVILGLWHTKFIPPAQELLPYCTMSHIGFNTEIARKYFFDSCEVFSMYFALLTSADGQLFIKECKAAGKKLAVWTVNDPLEMAEAVRWGADVILTDVPKVLLDLRASLDKDYDTTITRHGRTFLWTTFRYYRPVVTFWALLAKWFLTRKVGPLQSFPAILKTRV